MNKSVLACQDLSKRFKEGPLDVEVLKKVSIQVEPGQRIAIMGASGSGKSTLLHLLGGLESPSSGQVFLDGQSIIGMNERQLSKLRNKSLGFIYQFHHLLGEFTLVENVAMPLLIRGDDIEEAEIQAHAVLERVGLKQRTMHKPGELSGGERQRAAIARALVTRPKCVLADEPTGNLDRKTADHVYELMLELNKEYQVSFVVVTHDSQLAAKMDQTYTLQDGAILN